MTERSSRLSSASVSIEVSSKQSSNVSQQRRRTLANRMSICSLICVFFASLQLTKWAEGRSWSKKSSVSEIERELDSHPLKRKDACMFEGARLSRIPTTNRKRSWQICSDWITWPLRYLGAERRRRRKRKRTTLKKSQAGDDRVTRHCLTEYNAYFFVRYFALFSKVLLLFDQI